MTSQGQPYIHCQDLFKIYKRAELEVVALRGLDLEVKGGEFLAIVGTSGSGKSTLMNVLAGLDRPSAGQVRVGEDDLLDLSERGRVAYRRSKVGFLWQATARNLLPYLTARENIELPMAIAGATGPRRREEATALLSTVGLDDKAGRLPYQLSGGEQQRVAIGVALANRPALLLADEPTGELDTTTAEEVFRTLGAIAHDGGVTVIIVTHYPGIARFVDRVAHIRDGRIAAETVMEPTFRHPDEAVEREYLVVDRAGRLQLPPEGMARLGPTGRARMELGPDGVLIRPTETQE